MLLNELQKQAKEKERQADQIKALTVKVIEVEASAGRELRAQQPAFD
jgi:hypothetical protein